MVKFMVRVYVGLDSESGRKKEEGPRDSHRSRLCPLEKAPPVQ
jgi:hypothetical protein